MSISRRGLVNLSTPTFCNISLTEAMTNLLAACRFIQKTAEVISIYTLNPLKLL